MHIALVNCACDERLPTPEALLARYTTLTGWSEALVEAGAARVSVVQRFAVSARVTKHGVDYWFVDGAPARAAAALRPDIVHVNGLGFPMQAWRLRQALPDAAIVLQHRAGGLPRDPLRRAISRAGLRRADGFLFSATGLARPWQIARLIEARQPIYEVVGGSTHFRPVAGAESSGGLPGDPAVLWVGRLNANKDPLTVLDGFDRVLSILPDAHLTVVYSTAELLPLVRARIDGRSSLRSRVHLAGQVAPRELESFYSAADLFVLGSHHESTGFAAIEALACGATPVLTDIPAFRVVTADGAVGALWPPGDAGALAEALIEMACRRSAARRREMRARFEAELSWTVIGRRAMAAYRDVLRRRGTERGTVNPLEAFAGHT